MEVVNFRGKEYPQFITKGFHARFIMPVAEEVIGLNKLGVDVGCKHREWAYPGSICVDSSFEDGYDASNLPYAGSLEYIFSSHCLEHIEDWEFVLKYWYNSLAQHGTLFLYLPHTDNEYWDTRFMPTKRHVNNLTPEAISYVLSRIGFNNVFTSQRDAAYSFAAYGVK